MNEYKERKSSDVSAVQNLIVTTLIIIFFVGIIIIYYINLYSETRDNILKSGELSAVNSAGEIDKYLSTGIDVINLTGYTLDNMLREHRSQEEILDYLTNQSVASANIMSGNTTGIYGYINNEYLDGSGWVPDSDYVPTERPWYIEAKANSGRLVVVDPYIDAQTNTLMITLARTLCDCKSVVAADFSMEKLQSITEEIVSRSESVTAIILDENYSVIAHSDKQELGKNYLEEKGTIGNAIAEKMTDSDETFFSMKYGNYEYIVYAMKIQNDWLCVSVTDATSAFQRLTLPLVLTIAAAIMMIAILLNIMIRSNRKSLLAEKMKNFAEMQTKYAYFDQMTDLRNRRAYSEMIKSIPAGRLSECCIVAIDINGLKKVNDTYGHDAGDELIVAVSECIRSSFIGVEGIYRLGGDEFCVIMTDGTDNAEFFVKKLVSMASEWAGKHVNNISVSYGISYGRDHDNIEEVIKEADMKMYEYKRNYYSATGRDRRANRR